MEGLTALFALGAVLVVAAFIAQPLLSRRQGGMNRGGRRRTASLLRLRADLLAERNRIYADIRDLDFDYKTNKLTDEDYAAQRYTLVAQGVDVLQRLDALPPLNEAPENDVIETSVAAARGNGEPVKLSTDEGKKPGAMYCPQCGQPAQKSDRFCSTCGARL